MHQSAFSYQWCFKYKQSAFSFCDHCNHKVVDVFNTWTLCGLGVLMWEVYNEGRLPYDNRSNSEVVESLNAGLRLLKPRLASDAVYMLMDWCWKEVRTGNLLIQQATSD